MSLGGVKEVGRLVSVQQSADEQKVSLNKKTATGIGELAARHDNTLAMCNPKSRTVTAEAQGKGVDSVVCYANEKVDVAEGQNQGGLTPGKAVQERFGIGNINQTSSRFLERKGLKNRIDANFSGQVESLKKAVDQLPTQGEKILKTAQALLTLNGLLCRYNSEAFAGFKGLKFAVSGSEDGQFKELVKAYDLAKKNFNDAEKQLEGCNDDNLRPQLELLNGKVVEAEGKIQTFVEGLKERTQKTLDSLTEAAGRGVSMDDAEASSRAKFLNEMQKVSLGAWIFNDIAPAFDCAGVTIVLGKDLENAQTLNQGARATPMFSEVRRPNENNEAAKQWDEFFTQSTGNRYAGKKFGLRGRSGFGDKVMHTDPMPVCNTKGGEATLFDRGDYSELRAGFVPTPSARREAVPQEMCDALNEGHYGELADYLCKQKVINDSTGFLVPAPSYASFIDDAGLPTYCSVSGTTGELVSTLAMTADSDVKGILRVGLFELLDVAKKGGTERRDGLDRIDVLFTPIATFMELGGYHTSAEVLGGFYSVAVALLKQTTGKTLTAAEMEKGFKNLLEYFKANMDQFLPQVQAQSPQVHPQN
jgi:hypothetical protein